MSTKACENDPEVPLEVYNMIMDSKSEFTIEDLSNAEIDEQECIEQYPRQYK